MTGHRVEAVHRGMGQLSLRVLRKGQCRVGSRTKSFDLSPLARWREAGLGELIAGWGDSGSDGDWWAAIASKLAPKVGVWNACYGGGSVVLNVVDIAEIALSTDTLRPHVAGDDMRTKRVVEMAFWRHDR
jgi:hypothetical protein